MIQLTEYTSSETRLMALLEERMMLHIDRCRAGAVGRRGADHANDASDVSILMHQQAY